MAIEFYTYIENILNLYLNKLKMINILRSNKFLKETLIKNSSIALYLYLPHYCINFILFLIISLIIYIFLNHKLYNF